jgi:hypothetical protein
MTDIPIKYLMKRFAIIYLIATFAFAILSTILEHVFGLSIGTATGVVPLAVTAIDMGQNFFKKTGRVPEKYESWRLARWATVVSFAVSLILMALFAAINPSEIMGSIAVVGLPGFLLIIGVVMLLSFLIIRMFIGLGAKGIAKANQ